MESIVVNHFIYEEQVREKFGGEGKRETLLLSTVDYWECVKKKARLFSEVHSGRMRGVDTSCDKENSN